MSWCIEVIPSPSSFPLFTLTDPADLEPLPFRPSVPMSDEPVSGDFTALYRKTLAPLRRYLTRLLSNAGEAQEIAHDAYLRVYPLLNNRTARRPAALLFLTARRLAINRLKHRDISSVAHEALGFDAAASTVPDAAQQVMVRQELSLLKQAVEQLPRRCRAVLLLRNLEMLSHREIADRLGITVSTVEKQHARALRLLRAAMPSEAGRPSCPPAPLPDIGADS